MGFTNNDILTLARAGFTASQISALNSVGANPPANTVTPVTNTAPITQTPAQMSTYNGNDTLDKILNAIQTSAIHATQQPQPQTTDDILAEIINPPTNDK